MEWIASKTCNLCWQHYLHAPLRASLRQVVILKERKLLKSDGISPYLERSLIINTQIGIITFQIRTDSNEMT